MMPSPRPVRRRAGRLPRPRTTTVSGKLVARSQMLRTRDVGRGFRIVGEIDLSHDVAQTLVSAAPSLFSALRDGGCRSRRGSRSGKPGGGACGARLPAILFGQPAWFSAGQSAGEHRLATRPRLSGNCSRAFRLPWTAPPRGAPAESCVSMRPHRPKSLAGFCRETPARNGKTAPWRSRLNNKSRGIIAALPSRDRQGAVS